MKPFQTGQIITFFSILALGYRYPFGIVAVGVEKDFLNATVKSRLIRLNLP